MEQQEGKTHFVRRFLRGTAVFIKWLFVILLTLLLGAGIYFHAPWKVLTLIAIFLAAHTLLKKRFHKSSGQLSVLLY
jgi:uncharacterized membrane-anchored protein